MFTTLVRPFVALFILSLSGYVFAYYDPEHVKRYMTTAECDRCDLSGYNGLTRPHVNKQIKITNSNMVSTKIMPHGDFSDSILTHNCISDLDFSKVTGNNANFSSSRSYGTCKEELMLLTRPQEAIFTSAELNGAKFISAKLAMARFDYAKLAKANFQNAELGGADFTFANLKGADFTGANISGVDFTRANLTGIKGFRNLNELYPKVKSLCWAIMPNGDICHPANSRCKCPPNA